MGTITEREAGSPSGTKCVATCKVISTLKGEPGSEVRITFRRNANGPRQPSVDDVKSGEAYVVLLRGKIAPYEMFAAMKAVDAVVEPTFGAKPGDRLLAELAAMWKSNDVKMRIEAIEQIGIMRDTRGSKEVNAAAQDKDAETARAGVIAQYRMKIAPDAKRVMELFNEQIMDVWYEESGEPQKDSKGHYIWREPGGPLERGLPDFDYATYVRQGIKNAWVRKDDNTLYVFFGIPWKVQRKECVPEFVKLLEHPDKKVRFWAVECLTHTVENVDRPGWEEYEKREKEELVKWHKWWKDKGPAFMAKPATHREPLKGGLSPGEERKPENLTLTLAWIADAESVDGKNYIFVVNGVIAYRTLDGLKKYIQELPKKSTLTWTPGCCRQGSETLLSFEEEMQDFKAFCKSCGIHFVLVPSG
jgi:hypothetical protein